MSDRTRTLDEHGTWVEGSAAAEPKTTLDTSPTNIRRFVLDRAEDITGLSGTGIVAEGVRFTDGTVAMRWLTETTSTVLYHDMDDVLTIHGHEGSTTAAWLD
jgi:hypothetical protein